MNTAWLLFMPLLGHRPDKGIARRRKYAPGPPPSPLPCYFQDATLSRWRSAGQVLPRHHPQIGRRYSRPGRAGPTHPTPRSIAERHNTVHSGLTSRSRRQLRVECRYTGILSVLLIVLLHDDSHSNTLRSDEPRRVWQDDPTPTSGSGWSAVSSARCNQMRAGHWQARPARAPPRPSQAARATWRPPAKGQVPTTTRSGKSSRARPWTLNWPLQGGTIA